MEIVATVLLGSIVLYLLQQVSDLTAQGSSAEVP
jgi:hypothetical protein